MSGNVPGVITREAQVSGTPLAKAEAPALGLLRMTALTGSRGHPRFAAALAAPTRDHPRFAAAPRCPYSGPSTLSSGPSLPPLGTSLAFQRPSLPPLGPREESQYHHVVVGRQCALTAPHLLPQLHEGHLCLCFQQRPNIPFPL